MARWPDIVGAAYAGGTAPERIRWPRDGKAATLFVRCDPALALQFAHETDRVRERLNGYFGYPAVGAIRIVPQRVGAARAGAPRRQLRAKSRRRRLQAKLAGCDAALRARSMRSDAPSRALVTAWPVPPAARYPIRGDGRFARSGSVQSGPGQSIRWKG